MCVCVCTTRGSAKGRKKQLRDEFRESPLCNTAFRAAATCAVNELFSFFFFFFCCGPTNTPFEACKSMVSLIDARENAGMKKEYRDVSNNRIIKFLGLFTFLCENKTILKESKLREKFVPASKFHTLLYIFMVS